MKLEVNKMITLNNDEKYVILEEVEKDGTNYYYIAEVNNDETDIKDVYKIISTSEKDGLTYLNEITDETILQELLPLFLSKMPE